MAAPASNSVEGGATFPLEARTTYSCNPLHTNPCPGVCAAGSVYIDCSASYVGDQQNFPREFVMPRSVRLILCAK